MLQGLCIEFLSARTGSDLLSTFRVKGIYHYGYLSTLPTICSNRLQQLVPVQAIQHNRETQRFFSARYLAAVGPAGLTADTNGPYRYCPSSCAERSCRVLMPTF